jgi:hypothetical protein
LVVINISEPFPPFFSSTKKKVLKPSRLKIFVSCYSAEKWEEKLLIDDGRMKVSFLAGTKNIQLAMHTCMYIHVGY